MSPALPEIDYASHPAYGAMFEPDAARGAEALGLLQPLIDEMTAVEAERVARFGYRYGLRNAIGEEIAARGVSCVQLSDQQMAKLMKNARPLIRAMQDRISQTRAAGKPIRFKTVEQVLSMEGHGGIWKAVNGFLSDLDVLPMVADFFGASSARINSLALFVNPDNQDWASRLFRDVDIETPPTAGFHIDSNGKCYLKGILYLNEVGPDQGPTGVVPESHLWGEGDVDRIYRRAFDRSRLLARSAEERHMFVSLPKHMQVKAEFGGDMVAGSPQAEALLAQEQVSTGSEGFLTLFYPEAIHRGGNVRSGERHALQITLTAQF
jgi:hypothetical protein